MREYFKPKCEVIGLDIEDIIAYSNEGNEDIDGGIVDGNTGKNPLSNASPATTPDVDMMFE